MDKIFLIYVKTISHAVDVIEVTDHLGGIMNGLIGKTVLAQGFNISISDGGGGAG